MKAFFEKFVDRLPNLSSPSHYKVECVNTAKEADTKLTKLLKETPVKVFGVDFEWPPCFVKGKPENKIALIQICSSKKILLIQVGQMKELPLELMNFFESKDFLKTGVNIKMDGLKLYRDFGIRTNGLVELMTMVKSSKNPLLEKIHLRSLRALTAIYLKQKMGKGKVRTSNWAAPFLNAKQKQYAALDAYVSSSLLVGVFSFCSFEVFCLGIIYNISKTSSGGYNIQRY
ncbi:ribonuclease H-like domain-containing protein [Sporodiniella umbellata]|nr:ribonuclease H-like domain-containing protein [Sporodiniella umbellata]